MPLLRVYYNIHWSKSYVILTYDYFYPEQEEDTLYFMEKDKLTYITEKAAYLSPENQDRIIIAIEQLLEFENGDCKEEHHRRIDSFEIQTDI